ncbi:hydroxymethylpyrimidine/phosphomethylpyrimidine kinase [Corynebacterium glutamicum]|nr:hydroxymethylpyrimidine/phosphomethylpyrimidine kinase [Corynebacterium glutamicum]WBG76211.1 hydroxymethylpyrimidine/phosphomethylpyrimidine kinase [Corynebacterium glutamicum]
MGVQQDGYQWTEHLFRLPLQHLRNSPNDLQGLKIRWCELYSTTGKDQGVELLPQATVVTPNNFEASTLSGLEKLETVEDLKEAARLIYEQGPQYVVVKGGMDFPGENAVDVLFDGSSYHVFSEPKIGEERVSGAGCTFAAVITAELAKGAEVVDAVATAKRVVTRAVQDAVASNAPFTSVWLAEDNK